MVSDIHSRAILGQVLAQDGVKLLFNNWQIKVDSNFEAKTDQKIARKWDGKK